MNKEIVKIKTSKTKLKVYNNKVESVFKSVNEKTGLRLYDNNKIGIAGVIGAADEVALEKKAKTMLNFAIPYPVEPTKNAQRKMDCADGFEITDKELADTTDELLNRLSKNYPAFAFSEDVQLIEQCETLKNDCGTELVYSDKLVQMGLVIKNKKSLNMMDGFAINVERKFDLERSYAACVRTLDAYNNLVDIKDGEVLPVIFCQEYTAGYFYQHLHGKMFGAGASLFANKVGEKLFSDKFSFIVNRNSREAFATFFDGEGTTLDGDRFNLIENGVIKSPYTSKKVAKDFGFANTACASFIYDAVPDVAGSGLEIACGNKTLFDLIGNNRAVLVEMASGGDFTAQGEYSTPVQVAYLWENNKIVGRLPQIAVSSTVGRLFGDDFLGKTTDGIIPNNPLFNYLVHNMKVNKIGGHM